MADWQLQLHRCGELLFRIELVCSVFYGEEFRKLTDGLRSPQPQNPSRVERVVNHGKDALLQFSREINEYVPAGDEIDLRKRRIGGEILF